MSDSIIAKGAMEYCMDNLASKLSAIPNRSLLANGNAEKQLKFLLASSLDDNFNWYVMDKKWMIDPPLEVERINEILPKGITNTYKDPLKSHEIDLIALHKEIVIFAVEAKCTFIWDKSATNTAVKDAIKKAAITKHLASTQSEAPWPQIGQSKQYIVHFLLLSDPRIHFQNIQLDKPKWIKDKYNVGAYSTADASALITSVKSQYCEILHEPVNSKFIIPDILAVLWVEL